MPENFTDSFPMSHARTGTAHSAPWLVPSCFRYFYYQLHKEPKDVDTSSLDSDFDSHLIPADFSSRQKIFRRREKD